MRRFGHDRRQEPTRSARRNSNSEFVAFVQGTLVGRILFHVTETGRTHAFGLTSFDEDGGEVGRVDGDLQVDPRRRHAPGWDHGVNVVVPLTGLLLPRSGLYQISLTVDGKHLDDRPFRVVKAYP